MLTSLALLHGGAVSAIFASDIDEGVVALARRNLSLLTGEGMAERVRQIQAMLAAYGKDSHREALESALRLQEVVRQSGHSIRTECFAADATEAVCGRMILPQSIDMVITDLPYGDLVEWSHREEDGQPIGRVLDNLLPVLAPHAVAAVIAAKQERIQHEKYRRIERFSVGKRQIVLLRPLV